jgi:excisionase family DNA binding protein
MNVEETHRTISPRTASRIYDIPRWTIYSWIWKRSITIHKIGRKVLIPVVEFEEFLKKHRVEPRKEGIT